MIKQHLLTLLCWWHQSKWHIGTDCSWSFLDFVIFKTTFQGVGAFKQMSMQRMSQLLCNIFFNFKKLIKKRKEFIEIFQKILSIDIDSVKYEEQSSISYIKWKCWQIIFKIINCYLHFEWQTFKWCILKRINEMFG